MSDESKSRIESEVMQIFEDFFRIAQTLDFDRFLSFFDHSEATTWIDDGFFARSWDGLYTALHPLFSRWATLELHIEHVHVDILAPGVVAVTGKVTMAGTFKTGEVIRLRQAGTYVLIQRDGEWKFRHLQASNMPD